MARYVDSGYGTQYGRPATPPMYDGYDRNYGSYSTKGGGVVGDAWRVPQTPVGNNYQREEIVEYAKKPYPSPAATHGYGYGSSGQSYQPSEYSDYSGNKDWRKSGGNDYRGEKDKFHYPKEIIKAIPNVIEGQVASRPGHGTGSLSNPTHEIGAAIELLKDTAMHSSASGSYPPEHPAGTRYTESVSTVYYYPEMMPPTMDPTKRYGSVNLGSRRPAVAETGRTYY